MARRKRKVASLASCYAGGPGEQHTNLAKMETRLTTTSDDIEYGRTSYGAMPQVVLTVGDIYARASITEAGRAISGSWASLHEGLAAMTTGGIAHVIPDATHSIILDRSIAIAIIDILKVAHRAFGEVSYP